jgi:hypothetical protein
MVSKNQSADRRKVSRSADWRFIAMRVERYIHANKRMESADADCDLTPAVGGASSIWLRMVVPVTPLSQC